ncbi:MAG TPA: ATP-dependent sacrificial sulfur transferase LarE [Elusimicrobia bacterium]|nr:ATP-dependent sacrificial sulfur transferase LarE [Elusimicrobiota bacterium]
MENIEIKLRKLENILKKMGRVLIAYSGGVDTTFLLAIAKKVLKDKVVAVTAVSPLYPKKELEFAQEQAKKLGVKHLFIHSNELKDKKFVANPPQRCYYCKNGLYAQLHKLAEKERIKFILDGTNYSDRKDFRPGRKAGEKWQIRHPLEEAKLTKDEIRLLSKEMGLVTWDKPAQPCLASRIPYGEEITLQKIKMVESAENFLNRLGFREIRVRTYNGTKSQLPMTNNQLPNLYWARIELAKEEMVKLSPSIMNKIVKKLKTLGYRYITLDLEGYRMGSMHVSPKL